MHVFFKTKRANGAPEGLDILITNVPNIECSWGFLSTVGETKNPSTKRYIFTWYATWNIIELRHEILFVMLTELPAENPCNLRWIQMVSVDFPPGSDTFVGRNNTKHLIGGLLELPTGLSCVFFRLLFWMMEGNCPYPWAVTYSSYAHGSMLIYGGGDPLCMTDIWFTYDSPMTPMWLPYGLHTRCSCTAPVDKSQWFVTPWYLYWQFSYIFCGFLLHKAI